MEMETHKEYMDNNLPACYLKYPRVIYSIEQLEADVNREFIPLEGLYHLLNSKGVDLFYEELEALCKSGRLEAYLDVYGEFAVNRKDAISFFKRNARE